MDWRDMMGFVAGSLTTAAFVPQVWKVFRTRKTADLSLGLFALSAAGMSCWLLYGILIGSFPIILFNSIACALALSILIMKIVNG